MVMIKKACLCIGLKIVPFFFCRNPEKKNYEEGIDFSVHKTKSALFNSLVSVMIMKYCLC